MWSTEILNKSNIHMTRLFKEKKPAN